MELKQVKELMAAMEKAGIKRLRVKETDGYELEMERKDESAPHAPMPVYHHAPHPEIHSRFPTHRPEESRTEEKKADGKFVTAPLVGTMYHAASPEDAAFVKVGDRVDENTIVCIIEAMKVMNEVKAGMSGTIAEILIDNAHPVEFGTKLFRIV
ncbi:MAG TPA: acetyl-CoA carboxylase biotin carboxyl carrier protein [Rhabdochlamydiaceae bacterium]|jgi:acetyl-CoA carboxylase biotin carboxyl carrier protein|nr:acetyl-CoA carboxylase biotin carboxyl carrier protein [Rhabdochlamydiaceae bacterium]